MSGAAVAGEDQGGAVAPRLTGGAWRLLLHAAFIAVAVALFWRVPGDDLVPSYVGCRLLAEGGAAHLYDHDPAHFDLVSSAAWDRAAQTALPAGVYDGSLHPYVQTPLWTWMLRPACTNIGFPAFRHLFLVLEILSVSAMVEIVARHWARRFLQPGWLALLLAGILYCTPFRYAMYLLQTHALLQLSAVAGLCLAARGRGWQGGGLLAFAAAVKITPGFLVLFWLARGNRRAVCGFAVASALLFLLALIVAGSATMLSYAETLRWISGVLLVSANNQSLAAWAEFSPVLQSELSHARIFSLPPVLRLGSLALVACSAAACGLLARRAGREGPAAALALVAVTIFTPIAWTHYFIVLIPGIMIIAGSGFRGVLAALAILALNALPISVNPSEPQLGPPVILYSHFYGGLLSIAALAAVMSRRGAGKPHHLLVSGGCGSLNKGGMEGCRGGGLWRAR